MVRFGVERPCEQRRIEYAKYSMLSPFVNELLFAVAVGFQSLVPGLSIGFVGPSPAFASIS